MSDSTPTPKCYFCGTTENLLPAQPSGWMNVAHPILGPQPRRCAACDREINRLREAHETRGKVAA